MINSKPHSQSGFTLIELLISMTIMGMIMVLLASGLRLISSSWDRNNIRMEKLETFNKMSSLFRRDVEGIRRIVQKVDNRSNFIFRGNQKQLAFISLEPPFPTLPGLYYIEYDSIEGKLNRSRRNYDKVTGIISPEIPGSKVTLFDQTFTYNFEYGAIRNNKIFWSGLWEPGDQLPAMIKLVVKDNNKKDPLKTVPVIAMLRINGEQECIAGSISPCTARTDGVLKNTKKLQLGGAR